MFLFCGDVTHEQQLKIRTGSLSCMLKYYKKSHKKHTTNRVSNYREAITPRNHSNRESQYFAIFLI